MTIEYEPMTAAEVLEQIDFIAATPEKKLKESLVRDNLGDENFARVIRYALDPTITYGVASLPKLSNPAGHKQLEAVHFLLLDDLINRDLTGKAASTEITSVMIQLDDNSRELLRRIILKDLKAGFGVSTVNKAVPGTLPEFNCMLAAKMDWEKIQYPIGVEPKYDGMRAIAMVTSRADVNKAAKVNFFTRSGKAIDSLPETLKDELRCLANHAFLESITDKKVVVFEGEIIGKDFRDTMKKAKKKDSVFHSAQYVIFDWLEGNYFVDLKAKKLNKHGVPYQIRQKGLSNIFDAFTKQFEHEVNHCEQAPSYIASTQYEILTIYNSCRNRGLEGVIVKSLDGKYHPRRHKDWMKIKDKRTIDVPIVAFTEGTGKAEGSLGALVVQVKGVEVNVGSGFTDEQRAEIWNDAGNLVGRIIEVSFHEFTPDGSLRHPVFEGFRDDKTVEDGIGV